MAEDMPAPKFRRFERVLVVGEPQHYPELRGRSGTILWCDDYWVRQSPVRKRGWLYLVFFAPETAYRSLFESDLQSEGTFEPESAHLALRPEFSFDIIMEDDMNYVEGTYRLPGRFWEVMIFRRSDVPQLQHRPNQPPVEWSSGITGTVFDVPRGENLNREYVRKALRVAFGHEDWVEIRGPDSMVLR